MKKFLGLDDIPKTKKSKLKAGEILIYALMGALMLAFSALMFWLNVQLITFVQGL